MFGAPTEERGVADGAASSEGPSHVSIGEMFGSGYTASTGKKERVLQLPPNSDALLETPSHLVPPISKLSDMLMGALLHRHNGKGDAVVPEEGDHVQPVGAVEPVPTSVDGFSNSARVLHTVPSSVRGDEVTRSAV